MKKNGFIKELVFWLGQILCITGLVTVCMCPFSCRMTEEGIILVSEVMKGPKIDSFCVTGENSARIVFDGSVKLKVASLSPSVGIAEALVEESDDKKGMCCINLVFEEKLEVGETYRFYGEVQDRVGNSLSFSLPLVGFNGRLPELEITEVHPKYGSSSSKTNGIVFKCEYVELRILKPGNLAGLELYSAYDGKEKAFRFGPLDVREGDVIVVHLRNKEGMEAVNETGKELNLSKTFYSSDAARDLWAETDGARLGDDMDVILVRNCTDGTVLDAVCYASKDAADWKTEAMRQSLKSAVDCGKWKSVLIQDAVSSEGLTLTKSFEKTASGNDSSVWKITQTSATNPGTVNF